MSLASLFNWRKQRNEPLGDRPTKNPASAATASYPTGPEIRQDQASGQRYAVVLQRTGGETNDPAAIVRAWEALEEEMGLVPAGEVPARPGTPPHEPKPFVGPLYIDRYAVTNKQFAEFVADGGYDATDLWPEEVWPNVTQFVDQSGYPGPRYWRQGRPPKKLQNHPVVGVCWYEANAYALWAGKRLPTSIEWERAGTWPTNLEDQNAGIRYPWGNSCDTKRANTWSTNIGTTVEVNSFPDGCTPNGVYQLVGNVWEWVADEFHGPAVRDGLRIFMDHQMAEIRGGAFDTYFDAQATCRFRTGQPLLYRGPNVGFRCVVSADALQRPAESSLAGSSAE